MGSGEQLNKGGTGERRFKKICPPTMLLFIVFLHSFLALLFKARLRIVVDRRFYNLHPCSTLFIFFVVFKYNHHLFT